MKTCQRALSISPHLVCLTMQSYGQKKIRNTTFVTRNITDKSAIA
jgi:hypothetical protein